ncbi:MAG: hypothetical protein KKE17_05000 [Proteobacteria bacterium]|nr:hypothetical protein [Pseudomonadota bacterium]MBU1709346.1 hypothetical protein [Pseudomonadota bacterium]
MCQTLVDKVAQSRQLQAVAHPDILILFDSWLDEMEEEVIGFLHNNPGAGVLEIVEKLGLSKSGANFLLAKLKREKKIH